MESLSTDTLDTWRNFREPIPKEKTLEETKKNLIEAIQLVLEANRQMAEEEQTDVEVIKEPLGEVAI